MSPKFHVNRKHEDGTERDGNQFGLKRFLKPGKGSEAKEDGGKRRFGMGKGGGVGKGHHPCTAREGRQSGGLNFDTGEGRKVKRGCCTGKSWETVIAVPKLKM